MFKRRDEIDIKIAHYRELSRAISDKTALEGIDRMIADLEVEKSDLPPEPEK